jgi:hypothetical protein
MFHDDSGNWAWDRKRLTGAFYFIIPLLTGLLRLLIEGIGISSWIPSLSHFGCLLHVSKVFNLYFRLTKLRHRHELFLSPTLYIISISIIRLFDLVSRRHWHNPIIFSRSLSLFCISRTLLIGVVFLFGQWLWASEINSFSDQLLYDWYNDDIFSLLFPSLDQRHSHKRKFLLFLTFYMSDIFADLWLVCPFVDWRIWGCHIDSFSPSFSMWSTDLQLICEIFWSMTLSHRYQFVLFWTFYIGYAFLLVWCLVLRSKIERIISFPSRSNFYIMYIFFISLCYPFDRWH